jgi:prophage antirepressor-like protein
MSTVLAFQSTMFDVIDRDGQPWIQSQQLAQALGYKDEGSVRKIYKRNADEFTPSMSVRVNLTPTGGIPTETRIFSLRGCHLLAMFARTPVAKEFRVWVLDVLDRLNQAAKLKQKAIPSAEPGCRAIAKMADEMRHHMWKAGDISRDLFALMREDCDTINREKGICGTSRHTIMCNLYEASEKAFYAWDNIADTIAHNVKSLRLLTGTYR